MKVQVQSDDEPGIPVLDYALAPGFRRRYPLLAVVVVAGCVSVLFVVLVVPDFGPHHGRAKVAITGSRICPSGVSTRLELYRVHMGTYPESLRELIEPPGCVDEPPRKWGGPYVTDLEDLRDGWGRRLRYQFPGVHHPDRYDLWSVGPDGVDGTDDDIGNWAEE